MAEHKKQHFIPAFYLKAWCDPATPAGETPYVWLFEKDGDTSRRKAPGNIFHETEMYTLQNEDGTRNLRVEEGLEMLESSFARIRGTTLTPGQPLSEEDHIVVCAFIAAMKVRTKAHRDHQRSQWGQALRIMDDVATNLEKATPDKRERMLAALTSIAQPSDDVL